MLFNTLHKKLLAIKQHLNRIADSYILYQYVCSEMRIVENEFNNIHWHVYNFKSLSQQYWMGVRDKLFNIRNFIKEIIQIDIPSNEILQNDDSMLNDISRIFTSFQHQVSLLITYIEEKRI